ncbi:MAG: class I SAM-dependent methyltransferase [Anaerolineales bacterium]
MLPLLRRYYDANTRLFLRFGSSAETAAIHRALWMPGITRLADALSAAHDLILDEARPLRPAPRLLDLGCGVGAALSHLLVRLPASGVGLTISPVQARLAARHAPSNAHILEADFHALPLVPGFDLAYAIEAFVHAHSAGQFFREVGRVLRPGGLLILIDDFRGERDSPWRAVYQQGWHAPNLITVEETRTLAAAHNLTLTLNRDLTPYLRLRALPNPLARLLLSAGRPLGGAHPIIPSMLGSMALQQALRDGAVTYRMLAFTRA